MAPSANYKPGARLRTTANSHSRSKSSSITKKALFNRSINKDPLRVKEGRTNNYVLEDGTEIYDASCGAAVAVLGKINARIINAVNATMWQGLSYLPSISFDAPVTAALAQELLDSTGGLMKRAVFYCSGSEASEAALKLVTQYFAKEVSPVEPNRTIFIARDRSYHGATLGSLDASGHEGRKALYEGILPKNMRTIPACNPYRNQQASQSDEEYVQWHREQLIARIESEGKGRIAALIIEPVVGAAIGCEPAVPGYLRAMREVCDQYNIILIFDEVMCGMGRTGHLHAWQADGVVPDIQLIGKALGAGFQPISGMLVGQKIVHTFHGGPSNGAFNHGHTFQNSPVGAAAALEFLRIMKDENLLHNIREKGSLLQKKLRERLEAHRYVGDIRGPKEGLFIGIEFVKNKETKEPFDKADNLSLKIHEKGLKKAYSIFVYPGSGCVDGSYGDHIIISPPYNITDADTDLIVQRVGHLIEDTFNEFDASHRVILQG